MAIIVTGGAGFIGSNFVLDWFKNSREDIVVLDSLTYAGNLNNLQKVKDKSNFFFIHGDIQDSILLKDTLKKYQPRAIINFAAESHVDRSIHGPKDFINTNILGTFNLLESSRDYWQELDDKHKLGFRFLHVSTDEVYGSLLEHEPQFTEENKYQPNSPYSASKASSDHLVRAWYHTFNLPVLTTNCSNNYGPYQFPEKLIPLVITKALAWQEIPIYGNGLQIRDWLYVSDHTSAIRAVLEKGVVGDVYNIGGWNEKTNIEIVSTICNLLDQYKPSERGSYSSLIKHVNDRPGHDQKYAIDASKIFDKLAWKPVETFDTGIKKTIDWYLSNQNWISEITTKKRE
jgi:dTDP-glucose 4,6-dehydratase